MTLSELAGILTDELKNNSIEEAVLEAELLIRSVLKLSKVEYILADKRVLTNQEERSIKHALSQRLSGIPAAYIMGEKEFFGRTFRITEDVLIPRPETEIMIEDAMRTLPKGSKTLDIGTGSGVIAISMKLERDDLTVDAVDISEKAIIIATKNAKKLGARINFFQSDLGENIKERYDGILANLPYVPTKDIPDSHEPLLALDGGADGLDTVRRLINQLPQMLNPDGMAWLEIAIEQYPVIERFAKQIFPSAEIKAIKDLAGIDRFIRIKL